MLGLVLLPTFFCIYILDRIYLVPLIHLTALPITLWQKKEDERKASIIRVMVITCFNIILYWLI
jgi:hypothetical protein